MTSDKTGKQFSAGSSTIRFHNKQQSSKPMNVWLFVPVNPKICHYCGWFHTPHLQYGFRSQSLSVKSHWITTFTREFPRTSSPHQSPQGTMASSFFSGDFSWHVSTGAPQNLRFIKFKACWTLKFPIKTATWRYTQSPDTPKYVPHCIKHHDPAPVVPDSACDECRVAGTLES